MTIYIGPILRAEVKRQKELASYEHGREDNIGVNARICALRVCYGNYVEGIRMNDLNEFRGILIGLAIGAAFWLAVWWMV